MKRLHILPILMLAASLLVSCSRNIIDTQEPETWEYTLRIEDDATKSYITTDHVKWENGDKLGTFAIDASGSLTTKNSYSAITPGTPATFKLYLSSELSSGSTIYCYYPYDSNLGSVIRPSSVSLTIPSEQEQGLDGGLDTPLPMASLPYAVTGSMNRGQNPSGGVYLCNLFSIIRVDIYSYDPDYAKEKIENVTFTANDGIVGAYTIDLTKVKEDDDSTLSLKASSTKNSVTTGVSDLYPGHREGNTFVQMGIAPGRHSGTIAVKTDKAEYTASFGAVDFRRSKAKTIHFELSSDNVTRKAEGSDGTDATTWLDCFEVPANDVTLPAGSRYHSRVRETASYSETSYAYIFNTANAHQRIVTHTFNKNNNAVRNYTMLYDYDKRCALWVAYPMHGELYAGSTGRTESWGYDPAVPEQYQPDLTSSYAGNYDRGHQVASADRQTSYMANGQTFYFSNMTPQNSTLNGGKWATLESNIRSVGNKCTGRDTLYVVTGAYFDNSFSTTKDASGVACPIPAKYYKCIMRCSFNTNGEVTSAHGAAYVFDHSSSASRQDKSIDEVEALTGFDFFANVPASIQNAAESEKYRFF